MNNIQVFNNPEFGDIRTVEIDGEPWFVGKDVADNLGYQNGSRDINRHVDEEDRQNYQNGTFESNRGLTIINESGLYSLILSSKLPSARRFKHWVTSEVLPAIRKHGIYATEDVTDKILNNPEFGIELLTKYKEERDKRRFLSEQVLTQQKLIAELQPKADYVNQILKSTSSVKTTQIAKDYGMSARAFNKLLYELGIQYRVGDQWVLYAKYQACGYVRSVTYEYRHRDGRLDVKMCTEWTQKGRLFLYTYKSYRVFASNELQDGRILKCGGSRGKPEKFADTPDHCFIYNDDVNGVKVPQNLDKQWYIDLAKRRLKQFGIAA